MAQPPNGADPFTLREAQDGAAGKRGPRAKSRADLMDPLAPVPTGSTSVAIRPGTLIGDYQVIQRLDEGGMGTVYSAVHPVIEKKVAIKVLHPHVARQEETVARFIQEARAVNAIGHPGIIDIFGFGRFVDGRHYIIMEYLEGQQLLAYLRPCGWCGSWPRAWPRRTTRAWSTGT
jgi:serine/threonine protein kinase